MSEESSDGIVAYKNTNTDTIHLADGPNPDLEARANFVRVELHEVPPSALDAAHRARTERRSIHNAAQTRRDGGFVDGEPGGGQPVGGLTEAHATPPGWNPGDQGILSRPGMRPTFTGPVYENPAHQEALEQTAAKERATYQEGVLSRPGAVGTQHVDMVQPAAVVTDDRETLPPTTGDGGAATITDKGIASATEGAPEGEPTEAETGGESDETADEGEQAPPAKATRKATRKATTQQ